MVCYIVPLAAGVISTVRHRTSGKKDVRGGWLNLMFLGASVFGGIDHFWNGELFMIGANWMTDLALGGTITAGIVAAWGTLVYKDRLLSVTGTLGRMTGILK